MNHERAGTSLTIEKLWQFSLQYYSVREVKEACLSLQNNYHGNVNLLLMLKWLNEEGLTFSEQDWPKVADCITRSEHLLQHYREFRRKLKNHVSDTLYRESLQFELLLEKEQQSALVDCINRLPLTPNPSDPLVKMYCRHLGAIHLFEAAFAKPVPGLSLSPGNRTSTKND